MINFYHRFLQNGAETLVPLYDLLKTHSSRKQKLSWSDHTTEAFLQAQSLLANLTLLHHPVVNAPLSLTTDASGIAVGAVLEQYVDKHWQPLAFFSKRLRPPETRYSTFDRQLLSIYLSIKHFRFFLEGTKFTVFTDHKPLTFMFGRTMDPWSSRQARHIAKIAEFTMDVRHIAGKSNPVADALSRASEIATVNIHFDYKHFAEAQASDQEVQDLTQSPSITLEKVNIPGASVPLLCDSSTGRIRPILPVAWQRKAFDIVHGLSHPGIKSTIKQVSDKFFWHNMSRQVKEWAKHCVRCQTSKITRHIRPANTPFTIMPYRFQHLHLDLVGPLPTFGGFTHIFTIIDRYT